MVHENGLYLWRLAPSTLPHWPFPQIHVPKPWCFARNRAPCAYPTIYSYLYVLLVVWRYKAILLNTISKMEAKYFSRQEAGPLMIKLPGKATWWDRTGMSFWPCSQTCCCTRHELQGQSSRANPWNPEAFCTIATVSVCLLARGSWHNGVSENQILLKLKGRINNGLGHV